MGYFKEIILFWNKPKTTKMVTNWFGAKNTNSKSKPVESLPIIKIVHNLIVTFSNNYERTWTYDTLGDVGPVTPWRDFYTWYFGRRDSQEFAMKYKNEDGAIGENVIRRSDIIRFTVERREKKEISKSSGTDYPGPD